jgi:uracil-DNA glycosylase family 4
MIVDAPYTSGPTDTTICFIGQAPGRDEEIKGGAFVGPAGKQLTSFCASAGINREDCRLENLFQFFPPNDDLSQYIKLGTKNPQTTTTYYEHLEALKRRLTQCNANVLVPMGAIAMYALTGIVGGITKWRGSILESTLLPGRKVIPTIHPAATLKGEYLYSYFIIYDLIRVVREAEFQSINRRNRNLIIHPTFEDVCTFLKGCHEYDLIAYDIETRGMHLSHIAFAPSPDVAMCIPFLISSKNIWTPEEETEIMRLIALLLEDDKVTKVGQNLAFDCTFMYRHYGIYVRPIQDTMIAAAILFPDFPKGLDFLTTTYCDGEPYYKADGKAWKVGMAASEDVFRRYNCMDAAVLMEIWPRQQQELETSRNYPAYEGQRDLLFPLVYASDRGMPIDRAGMMKHAVRAKVRIAELDTKLAEVMGSDINYNSNAQLIQYFYTDKGIKPYVKRRKTGASTPTVDEKALIRLASHGHEEAKLILEIRQLQKMKGTYYEMMVDDDPVGTVQARISSSTTIWGTGGNLQNLTPDMRALLTADEGGIYIAIDLSQAENRIVAYEALEPKMMAAFENGVDLHTQTGCYIHGIPFEECTPEIRSDGKVANFGLNYGLGVENFIIRYELSREQGKKIWSRYHEIYPGIKQWHERVKEELRSNNRVLINCYGRRRRFLDRWGADLFERAYNYSPQSTIATKINNDGVKYVYYRQDLFHDVAFTNTVHDSIWLWCPLYEGVRRVIDVAILVKNKLEEPLTIKDHEVVIPADIKFGFSLNDSTMLEWKSDKVDFSDLDKLTEELELYVSEESQRLDRRIS